MKKLLACLLLLPMLVLGQAPPFLRNAFTTNSVNFYLSAYVTNLYESLVVVTNYQQFTNAVATWVPSGTKRRMIYEPHGITIHVTSNTVVFLKPGLDFIFLGKLVSGCDLGPADFDFDHFGFTDGGTPSTNSIYVGQGAELVSSNNITPFFNPGGTWSFINITGPGRVRNANTNLAAQASIFQPSGTNTMVVDVDEILNPTYDCVVVSSGNRGLFRARRWEALGQTWEIGQNHSTPELFFEFTLIEKTTNGLPGLERLFDVTDNVSIKGKTVNLGSLGWIEGPVSGAGSGIVDVDRIVQSATNPNSALQGQSYTVKNATIYGGTNTLVKVTGANLFLDGVILKGTSPATNNITAATAQTVYGRPVFTNMVQHPNITLLGIAGRTP